jgi:hypothetical protein
VLIGGKSHVDNNGNQTNMRRQNDVGLRPCQFHIMNTLRRGLSSYATAKLAISSNQHFSLTLVVLLCNNRLVHPTTWNIALTCSIASAYAVVMTASYCGRFMQVNRCVRRRAHPFFSDQHIFYEALRLLALFIALGTCQNSRETK